MNSHSHPMRPGLPGLSNPHSHPGRRWPRRLAQGGLALLALALVLGLLWWQRFALRPYQPSSQDLATRYAHASAIPITPQLRALGPLAQEIRFISFDGVAVNGRIQYPSDPAQAKAPFPLLIAMHGLGRSHMRWWTSNYKGGETLEHTHLVTELALKQGYAVLALDARRHGERKNLDYSVLDLMRDMDLWGKREPYEQMIIDSIKDYRMLLDWLLPQPQIDASRVQLTGYSMGGQMALILGSLEPRITAVAALVPPHLDDKVAAVSPQRFLAGLAGKKKLWLLSAEDDEYASAAQNQALFEALPGAAKQHLRFPGGHILPRDYPERLKPWF